MVTRECGAVKGHDRRKMLGLERSLGTRIVTYADDLVILCRKGKSRRGLAATARDHGKAEAHGQRGEDTHLQGTGRGVRLLISEQTCQW